MPSDRIAAQQLLLPTQGKGHRASDERLVELIGAIQDEFAGYGYRRVTRELQQCGPIVNHKRIARVMKKYG